MSFERYFSMGNLWIVIKTLQKRLTCHEFQFVIWQIYLFLLELHPFQTTIGPQTNCACQISLSGIVTAKLLSDLRLIIFVIGWTKPFCSIICCNWCCWQVRLPCVLYLQCFPEVRSLTSFICDKVCSLGDSVAANPALEIQKQGTHSGATLVQRFWNR